MIGMGVWFKKNAVVRFGPDYIVLNVAPLSTSKTVLKSEIKALHPKRKNYVLYYQQHGEGKKPKKMVIPTSLLVEEDRALCLSMLKHYASIAE